MSSQFTDDAPLLLHYPSCGLVHWRRKYAVLGHSMGGWLAYELVGELQKRGVPSPLTSTFSNLDTIPPET